VTAAACHDYFELQLRFAQRYAAVADVPLAEALGRCTNLRRRFGLAGPAGEDGWQRFLREVQGCSRNDDLLHIVMVTHDRAPPRSPSPFGCFTYDPPDAHGTLRLHFMPEDRHRYSSPLAESALPERRSELRALFMEVRRLHPDARQVRGLSWLYHLQAYRKLFPPAYAASVGPPHRPLHMTGSSTWGQVLDYRQRLKPGIADRVLSGIDLATVNCPWRAFPLQPLSALGSIEEFLGA